MKLHDALDRVGLPWPRHGKMSCPEHADKTPSLQLYEKTNSFYCFSCGKTGDGYGLYAMLSGTRVEDVLRASTDRPSPVKKASPQQMERQFFRRWIGITQVLFDAVRKDPDLNEWTRDLLLEKASEYYDSLRDMYDETPLSEREAQLVKTGRLVDKWIMEWDLAHPRSSKV